MRLKRVIQVIGAHCEGEVGNVVVGGIIDVPGKTMWDKKEYIENNLDYLRTMLLFEPRGGPNHAVNYLLPSSNPAAAMGYVIAEVGKYPPMSGSNTICVATVVLETGILPMHEPVTQFIMESPGGLIEVKCLCKDGKVTQVEFQNVPSFVLHSDKFVEVEGVGSVKVDTAYGGLVCAVVDAESLGFGLSPDEARDLGNMGQKIRTACNSQLQLRHPENSAINSVVDVVFTGRPQLKDGVISAKNVTMCNRGRLDRSPCGTGTSARLAVMSSKKEISMGDIFESVSIIGTKFHGRVLKSTMVGDIQAIVSSIAGQAWITGSMQYSIDPTDPFPAGSANLSDIWS
jgi:proline racemase